MKVMIDLYSGLGGASEAFLDDPEWFVVRFENNIELLGDVPNTHFIDILEMADNLEEIPMTPDRPDFIWASPPCLEFSHGYNAPAMIAKREGREFAPDLSHIEASMKIINHFRPRRWCVENVAGAVPHFNKIIGLKPDRVGPFYLWGNLPPVILPKGYTPPSKVSMSGSTPMSANNRAKIPYEVSRAVKEAVRQPGLEGWL